MINHYCLIARLRLGARRLGIQRLCECYRDIGLRCLPFRQPRPYNNGIRPDLGLAREIHRQIGGSAKEIGARLFEGREADR